MAELIYRKAFLKEFSEKHRDYFKPVEAKAVECIFDALMNAQTTTESEIRAKAIQKLIERCRKQKEQFPNDEDAYQFGVLNGINICIAEMTAEQLKGEA